MVRLRYDLDLLTDEVKQHILDTTDQQMSFTDITNTNNKSLVVFEVKITKAKDGSKNMLQYHLFNQGNLRIYEKLKIFYGDLKQFTDRSKKLTTDIEMLNMNSLQSSAVLMDSDQILL